jgi:hypothetical protein
MLKIDPLILKGFYRFLTTRRVKNNDFSQKSDEDGVRTLSR